VSLLRAGVRLLRALPALLLVLLIPPAAEAKQVTVSSGGVKATLTYSKDAANFGFKADGLTITRNGQLLYDAAPNPSACKDFPCGPTVGFGDQPPLRVVDLDADAEPEVIYSAYTGGAHCCSVAQVFQLAPGASGYSSVDRYFGDPGFTVRDLDPDGRPEVVSADDSFAYRFTAYAFSGLPFLALRYDHGKFRDVTGSFPRLIRRDARQFWRGYLKLRHNPDDSARGQVAAWAADQYRLGKRAYAREVLRREVRRGFLAKPGGGAKFIAELDRFLKRRGYA
jgi:hypothetical protein